MLAGKGESAMTRRQDRRVWLLIAAIAIVVALLLTLVPHAHSGNATDLLAILPILFIGVAFSLDQFSPLIHFRSDRVPETPPLADSFQRPPPPHLA
jgi:hypothetical protein